MGEAVYFLKIDLERLRTKLAKVEEREVANDDAFDWLLAHGFKLGKKGWYGRAQVLGSLDPSVIVSRERIL